MKFSSAFRQQVSSQLIPLLDRFEEVEHILAAEITETLISPGEPSQLVNHYLDLVSRLIDRQKIGVGGSEGEPVGLGIFNRKFDQLVALFQETHSQLLQLKAFEFPE